MVGVIGWWRENGAINRRTVGGAEPKGTARVLDLNTVSLRYSTDIQEESGEEAQAGNTMKGIISTWMIVRAMRLNEVTKEVFGKREEQRTIGSALDSALEQLHFEVRVTRMYQERRRLKLAPFLNLFIFSMPLNINVLLQNK